MPRKRMTHPGFFESENLADLDIAAMITYQGIWVFGDDRGRIQEDAEFIKFKVWPRRKSVTATDVADHIEALVDGEQLCRYKIGGGDFLHTIAWDEHQKISHPTPSKLPPCPVHQPLEYKVWWKDDDTATDRWRKREKAGQRAKSAQEEIGIDSGTSPENVWSNSGATPPQCSSVQVRSDQAEIRSDSGESGTEIKFVRPSQIRQIP